MEWIRVKDEFPIENKDDVYDEYNVFCLNAEPHKFIVTTLSWTEHGWYDNEKTCWNDFVTHWMPLPDPPK